MIVYNNITQGTEEWFALRRGRPTASRLSEIITAAKGEYSKSAQAYMAELLAECFDTDVVPGENSFDTYWTLRGKELEPLARLELSKRIGREAHTVGFCMHDGGVFGCSPDALFKSGDSYDAGGELKCPKPATHVLWMMNGVLPPEHKAQVCGSMVITGIRVWHFLSFCPGMQPFHVVAEWDDFTDRLAEHMERFTLEYKALHASLVPKLTLALPSSE